MSDKCLVFVYHKDQEEKLEESIDGILVCTDTKVIVTDIDTALAAYNEIFGGDNLAFFQTMCDNVIEDGRAPSISIGSNNLELALYNATITTRVMARNE